MHSHPQITVMPLNTGYLHSEYIRSSEDKTNKAVYTNPYIQEEDAGACIQTLMRYTVSIGLDPISIQAYQNRVVTSC
jgi:hypothetical protein